MEVVDHADVLPAAVVLLQHLRGSKVWLVGDAGHGCPDTLEAEPPPVVDPSGKA